MHFYWNFQPLFIIFTHNCYKTTIFFKNYPLLKYTLRYLANKFAICLIEFSLLLTTSWVIELVKQLRYTTL